LQQVARDNFAARVNGKVSDHTQAQVDILPGNRFVRIWKDRRYEVLAHENGLEYEGRGRERRGSRDHRHPVERQDLLRAEEGQARWAWKALRQCLKAGGTLRIYSTPNGLRDTTYYRLTSST
jgi:hypothetical protein